MPIPNQIDHIICFIDILGFRDKIFQNQTDFLEKYFAIKDYLISEWNKIDEKKNFKIHSFSDSIIISVETEHLSPAERKNQLKHLSIAVASLQFFMATNDIWVRGGISCGSSFINSPSRDYNSNDGTLLYGKAFIYAYELESKQAKYPRILLDTRLIDHCKFQDTYQLVSYMNKDNNFENWKGDLIFDWEKVRINRINSLIQNDYPLFLDYADLLFQELDTDNYKTRSEVFRNHLRKNLKLSIGVYEKYRWVADYLITKTELKLSKPVDTTVAMAILPEDLRTLYRL